MSETIINGIDVSECKYKFQDKDKFDGKEYCMLHNELCEDISFVCDENCQVYEDYKQLKRLQEKNEELKKYEYYYLDKYIDLKQALEETLKILCNGRTFYEGYFDNPNLSRTDEAIKVIKEVLK